MNKASGLQAKVDVVERRAMTIEEKTEMAEAEEKAETVAALVVSEYQSSAEMQQVKDTNFDEEVWSFLYNVVTERPEWDLSFLEEAAVQIIVEWNAPTIPRDEPPADPTPLANHPDQVIDNLVMNNAGQSDGDDDDVEQINNPARVLSSLRSSVIS